MEVISRKGGLLYCLDGFMYCASNGDNKRCVRYREKCQCTAKLVQNRTTLEIKRAHNHDPDNEEIERLKLQDTLKRYAIVVYYIYTIYPVSGLLSYPVQP